MSKNFVFALTTGVLLSSCGWMAPSFKLPNFGGTENTPLQTAQGSPFISPTVVGSWVVVNHAELKVEDGKPWYTNLGIPGLDDVMRQAMENNPTLQTMASRVKQARAEARIANAAFLPKVDASGNISRGRTSPAQQGLPSNASSPETTLYGAGLSASYEVDLFGRIGGEAKSSRLLALSQQDLYNDFKLVLEADVARTVVLVRATHDIARTSAAALADAEQSQKVLEARYSLGELAAVDYQVGIANLQNARAQALQAASEEQHARSALAALVGRISQDYVVPSAILCENLPTAPVVPVGISSTVLLRRPDVQAAAHQLEAANVQIGVARAAFFPQLSITGNGGFASGDFGNLFDWSNRTWAAGPVLTLPIFRAGALRANLNRSWAVYEQNVSIYREQVLTAFREVDDAITDARTSRLQADSLTQADAAMQKAAASTEARYKLGDAGKYEMLTARINAAQGRIAQRQAEYNSYLGIIGFMQATGGAVK